MFSMRIFDSHGLKLELGSTFPKIFITVPSSSLQSCNHKANSKDQRSSTPATPPLIAKQTREMRESTGSGVRLEINKVSNNFSTVANVAGVYEQDLAIIGEVGCFAVGFSLSLDFADPQYPDITQLLFKVAFHSEDRLSPTLIYSMFPPPRSKSKNLYRADMTIAYPRDFNNKFGEYRKKWRTGPNGATLPMPMEGIHTNQASWLLELEGTELQQKLIRCAKPDDHLVVNVEA
ncbi:hypothetical protein BT69DRAFT_1298152 [Atractiella rhizophila]|nr:hypothetical protein BT69DRAFT_1298152 [Atractiella rhizophila]